MLIIIVLVLFAAVIAFDFVPLLKQSGNKKKWGAAYLGLMLLSLAMLLPYSLYISVPTPFYALMQFIKQLFHLK